MCCLKASTAAEYFFSIRRFIVAKTGLTVQWRNGVGWSGVEWLESR
jgi:hypothetical protein